MLKEFFWVFRGLVAGVDTVLRNVPETLQSTPRLVLVDAELLYKWFALALIIAFARSVVDPNSPFLDGKFDDVLSIRQNDRTILAVTGRNSVDNAELDLLADE